MCKLKKKQQKFCHGTLNKRSCHKSCIDIVGVGGYGSEFGNFWIHLECVKYLYPIQESQVDPIDVTDITCNENISDSVEGNDPVKYHQFIISETTYYPININVTDGLAFYLTKSNDDQEYEIMLEEYSGGSFILHDEIGYPFGEYYIIVQDGYPVQDSSIDYGIFVECGDPPTENPTSDPSINPSQQPSESPSIAPTEPPKLSHSVMAGLVFGLMGGLLFLLLSYYIYEWIKYLKRNPISITKQVSRAKSKSFSMRMDKDDDVFSPIGQDEEDDDDDDDGYSIEFAATKSNADLEDEDEEQDEEYPEVTEFETNKSFSLKKRGAMNIRGVSIRRLDSDRNLNEQMDEDEDVVQVVLAHAISCCEDEEGFDIFQVSRSLVCVYLIVFHT